jgi:hypothetical protein
VSLACCGEANSHSSFTAALASNCTDSDEDGYSVEGGCCGNIDCDDSDPDIYPGATEKCNDDKDNDCDGSINEDCGCLAEGLFEQSDARIEIMRRLRDEALSQSKIGREYTELYYRHAPEAVRLLLEYSELRDSAGELLVNLIPEITPLLEGSKVELDWGLKEELLELLYKVSSKASPELQTSIEIVMEDIEAGVIEELLEEIDPSGNREKW